MDIVILAVCRMCVVYSQVTPGRAVRSWVIVHKSEMLRTWIWSLLPLGFLFVICSWQKKWQLSYSSCWYAHNLICLFLCSLEFYSTFNFSLQEQPDNILVQKKDTFCPIIFTKQNNGKKRKKILLKMFRLIGFYFKLRALVKGMISK